MSRFLRFRPSGPRCPTLREWADHALGQESQEQREALEAHRRGCAMCDDLAASVEALVLKLPAPPATLPPEAAVSDCPYARRLPEMFLPNLPGRQREELQRHLVECSSCRARLAETVRLSNPELSAEEADLLAQQGVPSLQQLRQRSGSRRRAGLRPATWAIAGLAAAAAVALLAVQYRAARTPAARATELMERVWSRERPRPERLSELPYSPYRPVRGAQSGRDLGRMMALLELEAAEQPSAESLHALGRFALMARTEAALARAVSALEQAAALERDPAIWNDLGAARLATEQWERAVEALDKALELDASYAPARFNRALAYEQRRLWIAARDEWQAYLRLDSSSPWAAEARQRLEDLKLRSAPPQKRSMGDLSAPEDRAQLAARNTLTRYLELRLETPDHPELRPMESSLIELAEQSKRRWGDGFLATILPLYLNASPAVAEILLAARRFRDQAHKTYQNDDWPRGVAMAEQAAALFEQVGDEAEMLAVRMVRLDHLLNLWRSEEVIEAAPRLSQRAAALGLPRLQVHILCALATAHKLGGHWSTALSMFDTSWRLAARVEYRRGLILAQGGLTGLYISLGDPASAAQMIARNHQIPEDVFDPQMRAGTHYLMAKCLKAQGRHRLAWRFARQAVADYWAMGGRIEALEGQVLVGQIAGRVWGAERGIRLLREAVARLDPAESHLAMVRAYLGLAELELERGRATSAVAALAQIDPLLPPDLGFVHTRAHLLEQRGRAYLVQRRWREAETRLVEAMRIVESELPQVEEDSLRGGFMTDHLGVYEMLQEVRAVHLKDAEGGFQAAERSRARALLASLAGGALLRRDPRGLDLAATGGIQPADWRRIAAHVAPNAALIELTLLDHQLLVWRLHRGRMTLRVVPQERERLLQATRRFQRSILAERDSEASGRFLFQTLLAPELRNLSFDDLLIVVPDPRLSNLPFAALVDSDGRYLVERHPLVVAPSATTYLRSLERWQRLTSDPQTMLAVGNPRVRDVFSADLPDLSRAEIEVLRAASNYDRSEVLLGPAATYAAILSRLPGKRVVHMALHHLPNYRQPLLGHLVVAPDSGPGPAGQGILYAHDLITAPLDDVGLLVLSTCSSGRGRVLAGEGSVSLARLAVARGVPTVVASLWDADSEASATMLSDFHRAYVTEGLPPARALASAQRKFLNQPAIFPDRHRLPRVWATFTTFGYSEAAPAKEVGDRGRIAAGFRFRRERPGDVAPARRSSGRIDGTADYGS